MFTLTSVTCKLATVEYHAYKRFFSLYIFFISLVFTQLPRTPNHFPLPRHWTRDRDFGPATATLNPRPRHWTRDRDFGPATRDPRLLVKLVRGTRGLLAKPLKNFQNHLYGQPVLTFDKRQILSEH